MVEDEKLRSILMKKFFQGDTLDNANAVVAKALKQKEEASKQFFFIIGTSIFAVYSSFWIGKGSCNRVLTKTCPDRSAYFFLFSSPEQDRRQALNYDKNISDRAPSSLEP